MSKTEDQIELERRIAEGDSEQKSEEEKAQQSKEQKHRHLTHLVGLERALISTEEIKHIQQEVAYSNPLAPEEIRNIEVNRRLDAIAFERAQVRLKQETCTTKQNIEQEWNQAARIRHQAEYLLNLLEQMIPDIQKLRTQNSFDTINLRPIFNALGSKINSFNKGVEILHTAGYSIDTLEPLDPHPHREYDWFLRLQNQEILSDEWLESARLTLTKLQAI